MNGLVSRWGWLAAVSTGMDLLRSLAWPLTVLAIAALFRAELRASINRVTRLKYRDFEADFREELRRVESMTPPSDRQDVRLELNVEAAREELPLSPRETVRRSWEKVERAFAGPQVGLRIGLSPADVVKIERLRSLARMVDLHADWCPPWPEAERFRAAAAALVSRTGVHD